MHTQQKAFWESFVGRLLDDEISDWMELIGNTERDYPSSILCLYLNPTGLNLNLELKKSGSEKFSPEFLSPRFNPPNEKSHPNDLNSEVYRPNSGQPAPKRMALSSGVVYV